jgi:hypothetical protein
MKSLSILTLIFASFFGYSQTNTLRVDPNIALPKDSVESKNLITSLNDFLLSAQKPNEENKFVFESEKIETFIQLDEIYGIGKKGKYEGDYFYKPYLTNVVHLKDKNYLIQVSYIGINENRATLRASFEFIAHANANTFTFSSPLVRNTKKWKVLKVGNAVFHYQYEINKKKVNEYVQLTTTFDQKLNAPYKSTDYYCTDDMFEMQKLVGVEYKSDYNGRTEGVWKSTYGDRELFVLGNKSSTFNEFDPHDTWHNRLYSVTSRNRINRPVDEGCAYFYGGGSWGISWKDVFEKFKEKVASNKNADWKEYKEKPLNFNTPEIYLYADYVVNALLVKKIEKEKGFAGVWELLNVGPFEKGNEKYYQTLEKLTGITKANYNEKIWELVNNEK